MTIHFDLANFGAGPSTLPLPAQIDDAAGLPLKVMLPPAWVPAAVAGGIG